MVRTALVLLLLPLLLLVAVVLGTLIPSLFIEDGVDSFEGAERAYSSEALEYVRRQFVTGSGRAFLVSAMRVTDVEACPDDDPFPGYLEISTEIELYTIFGIHYDTWDYTCEDELFVPRPPDNRG